jgi:hypothetical protein
VVWVGHYEGSEERVPAQMKDSGVLILEVLTRSVKVKPCIHLRVSSEPALNIAIILVLIA